METNKCPYCKKKLEKIPLKKNMCEFCGKCIYPRSHPNSKGKVLVTENELKKIEAEWIKYALLHKWFKRLNKWGVTKEDYLKELEILRQRFSMFPFMNDVFWSLFNKLLIECYKKGDLKKATLIQNAMKEFREEEEKKRRKKK
ncbi:MAG: hypothetical protein ABIH65_03800 [Nanoarchaeota archaeon]